MIPSRSNEYSDTVLWSPGPPNTAQTASSFSSSEASDSSALTPGTPWSSASDKSTRYYALPAFQVSPSVESACIPEPFQDMGKETSHTSRPRSSSSSTNAAAQPWPEERARTSMLLPRSRVPGDLLVITQHFLSPPLRQSFPLPTPQSHFHLIHMHTSRAPLGHFQSTLNYSHSSTTSPITIPLTIYALTATTTTGVA